MKIHHREPVVRKARNALADALHNTVAHHDLTDGEALRVVNDVLSDYVSTWAKYAIREERHGDATRAGGLEDG